MKIPIGPRTLLYPLPVVLVGTYDENNKANLMTASWCGICNSEPPCVNISLRKERHSYNAIVKNKEFSISFPSVDMVAEADYCGIFSGKNTDKLEDLNLHCEQSDIIKAPIIKECSISMLCRLKRTIDLGSHTMFIGEILDIYAESEVTDIKHKPIIEKVNPLLYDTTSKTYYSVGQKVMKAYTTKTIPTK